MKMSQRMMIFVACLACASVAFMPSGRSCFCKFDETVDECECSVDSVDVFNNAKLHPLLNSLLLRDFFRYYKTNMEKTCPFWPDDRECGSKECGIENCDDEVPSAIKASESSPFCGRALSDEKRVNDLDPLDVSLDDAALAQLDRMDDHDDMENKFCDVDHESESAVHYVDLAKNPERYTGYKGQSAQMVWKAIYQENCFKPNPKFDKNFLQFPSVTAGDLRGLCLEKRVFYRLISGLHTSITISIAAHNYVPPPGGFGQGTWQRNLEMFKWRFSPEVTAGEGPQRLKNLYFVYLLELRALHKLAPYLKHENFFTDNTVEDSETRELISSLHTIIADFPAHFDESEMFAQEQESLARELKEEFRAHFWNVSRIMDCVGCDKCRLWGKLQTHGIGTALRILFSAVPTTHYGNSWNEKSKGEERPIPFSLTRNDLVALLQSFGRFSSSIFELSEFRRLLSND